MFGRSTGADIYLDSKHLRNFISRRHAVVMGEVGEDGQLIFVLHNSGLNGTYINDVRVQALLPLHSLKETCLIIIFFTSQFASCDHGLRMATLASGNKSWKWIKKLIRSHQHFSGHCLYL